MDPFQLTEDAILDIDAIWLYLLEREGFKGFYRLAEIPISGHRRADLHGKRNVSRLLRLGY